jgi:hypothetical protein
MIHGLPRDLLGPYSSVQNSNSLEIHPSKGNPMNNAEPRLQEPKMPFLFAGAEMEGLRRENARLKHLVVRLSAIIAKNVAAQK